MLDIVCYLGLSGRDLPEAAMRAALDDACRCQGVVDSDAAASDQPQTLMCRGHDQGVAVGDGAASESARIPKTLALAEVVTWAEWNTWVREDPRFDFPEHTVLVSCQIDCFSLPQIISFPVFCEYNTHCNCQTFHVVLIAECVVIRVCLNDCSRRGQDPIRRSCVFG